MPTRIAIQGYKGSYHELAANKLFGRQSKEIIFCKTFIDVFESLDKGLVDYALTAIGNNRYGDINHVYDVLVNNHLSDSSNKYWISEEVYTNVEHCLLGYKGTVISSVKTIYSQAPAIVQCFGFIHTRLNKAVAVEQDDTALSAQLVSELKNKTVAAIASREAAKIFSLEILAEGIQDDINNFTRFILISLKRPKTFDGATKTSLLLSTTHKKGDLAKAMELISSNNINISYLQSVPIPNRSFDYRFYVDLDSGLQTKEMQAIVKGLDALGYQYDLLGSYKKAAAPKLKI